MEEVEKRGLHFVVHLLGQHPVENMTMYLRRQVTPRQLRHDRLYSMVVSSNLRSYMSCVRPVIAAIDAARMVRESGGGLASPSEDPLGLAGAVLRLARMTSADRLQMGRRNRCCFGEKFKRDLLIGQLERALNETADGRRVP